MYLKNIIIDWRRTIIVEYPLYFTIVVGRKKNLIFLRIKSCSGHDETGENRPKSNLEFASGNGKTNSVHFPDVSRARPSRSSFFTVVTVSGINVGITGRDSRWRRPWSVGGGRRRAWSSEQVVRRRERVPGGGEWKNRRRRAQFSYSRRVARFHAAGVTVSYRSCFVISDRSFRRLLRPTSLRSRIDPWSRAVVDPEYFFFLPPPRVRVGSGVGIGYFASYVFR